MAARRNASAGSHRKSATRGGAWLFTVLTLGTGAVAGIATLGATTAMVGVQTLASDLAPTDYTASPVEATTLFPPVAPVHKVVNVYDPPPAPSYRPVPRASGSSGTPSDDGQPEAEPQGGDD